MGWTCTYKAPGMDLTQWFVQRGTLKWTNETVQTTILASALVNLSEYYAAVEFVENDTGLRTVSAAVFMIKMFRMDKFGHNFCYKDMDETCGPIISNCPERILELLTPIHNAYAQEWRAQCWRKIQARKDVPKLVAGVAFTCATPIHFTDGKSYDSFVVQRAKGPNIWCSAEPSKLMCRIRRSRINAMVKDGSLIFPSFVANDASPNQLTLGV